MEFAGAYYHVMARGNRRGAIFLDDDDRRFFLQCLSEVCEKTGWRVHGWVLMGNHYHLFIETPGANLVEGMKWLQNTVTRRFNVRHREWGRLFGDRYKAVLVEGESEAYYVSLWDYLHLNPWRAGLIKEGGSVLDYAWSSLAGGFALWPSQRPKWLAAAEVFGILGYEDSAKGRREMVEALDARGRAEGKESGRIERTPGMDARMSHLSRGWYWGTQVFAEEAIKSSAAMGRRRNSRAMSRASERLWDGEARAREAVEEGLREAGLEREDLKTLRGNDARKVKIATRLWRQTTVSQAWIARELEMKSGANVSLCIHRERKKK